MSDFSLEVLQGYFDDLLAPAQQAPEPRQQRAEVAQQSTEPRLVDTAPAAGLVDDLARQKLERLLASRSLAEHSPETEDDDTARVPVVAESPVAECQEVVPASEASVVAEVPAPDPHFGWWENGRPAWAQERFDVLLFEVAGLTLAVPLVCLGQIQPLTDELTPLFGQADWFMGLHSTPMGQVRTINTARFVMPERYQEHFVEAARYVISIAGSPWGLAVDAVNQPITLQPEDVRWRGERSKRPWLAGTIKQHMCALLDVETMGQLLQQAEQTPKSARIR